MKPWERDWNASGPSVGGEEGPWARDWSGVKFDPGPKSRNLFAVANDTAIEIANAVAGNAGALANFVSPGNRFSRGVDEFVKRGEESQSDLVKADKRITRDEIEAADDWTGEVAAVGRGIIRNPLITAAQALGSFAGPGLAVKGAEAAALAAKLGPAAAARVGLGAGAAMGGAMTGGDAAGGAYELAIQSGATEEQAQAAARQASVLPGIVGAAGGVIGAERLLLGLGKGSSNPLVQAARGALVEGAQEGFEEGLTNYESRRAAQPFDGSIDPWKGAAASAAMGAALGGITGGAVGLVSRQADEEAKRQDAEDRLANAGSVDEIVKAANDLALTPLDEGRALDRLDQIRQQEEKDLKQFGPGAGVSPPPAGLNGRAGAQTPGEASAQVIDAPFSDRVLTLREQLADPSVREAIRETFGDEGLNNASYYAGVADKVGPDNLPERTRDNLLSVAEQMVRAAILKPIGTRPLTDQRSAGNLALPAPDDGQGGVPGIGVDTAPTGTFRVDTEGNAAPETRADLVSARDRERQRRAQEDGLGRSTPRGEAPQPSTRTSPLVEQQRAERRRTEGQTLEGIGQTDPVLSYVDRMRQTNTPAARAFVREFEAGRITRRDIIEVMQSQPADPLGDFRTEGLPADTASERLRRARDEGRKRQEAQATRGAQPQAPAPEAPDGIQLAPGYRTRAPKPEVIDGDLKTQDGMPYGSKSGANVRARREGLGPENVVEIPGAGWVVRPNVEASSEPVSDVDGTPGQPAASGDGRAPDIGRGELAVRRMANDPGRGVEGVAGAPVAGGAEAAPAGDGGGADAALRAQAIEAYKRASEAKYPGRDTVRTAEMAADRLLPAIKSKNADALIGMNLGSADMNPASRAVFEAVTGVKLPKGRAASERAIDEWAGVTTEQREAKRLEKRQSSEADAAKREADLARKIAQRISVKNGDRTVDGAAWVDELRANGFTNIVRRGPKTYLANADGTGWPMPHKDIAEYARRVAAAPNVSNPTPAIDTPTERVEQAPAVGRVGPATAQKAIDAFNADDAKTAMDVVARLPLAQLQEVGAAIGFRPQINENAKRYRERLAEVADKLTKTARETMARERKLFDKVSHLASEYDRAKQHMERARANGVTDPESTAFIGFYRPTPNAGTTEMRIPQMLDRLRADMKALESDADFAKVAPMVKEARPAIFEATAPNDTAAKPKPHAELEGKTIEQEMEVEGHKVVRRRDAAKALRALDEREASLRALLECLKGGG